MSRLLRSPLARAALLALPLLAGACTNADHIEIEQTSITLRRRGEEVWVRAQFKDRKGASYPRTHATWHSSDEKVVTVDGKEKPGNLKAIGPGHATVTVKGEGGLEGELTVHVVTAEKLQIEPAKVELGTDGEKVPLKITALDAEGHPPARSQGADALQGREDLQHRWRECLARGRSGRDLGGCDLG